MTKSYPNARQRDVLQILQQAEWTPLPRLAPARNETLANLINKGWIERRLAEQGPACYRITDLGRQAFRAQVPVRR
jgi:hypothetical protein